jgi:mandelate racemase
VPRLTVHAVRATAVHVPMRRPLGTSARRLSVAPLVLVDVETREGVTGRAYVFGYLPAATTGIAALVRDAGAQIVGQGVEPVVLQQRLAT